jgi:hypothetical protein
VKRALLLLALVGCGDDFAPKNQVTGIRILAARADLPYARPNESVKIEALVQDGRKAPTAPMHLYWFPVACVDPPGGQYWGCFPFVPAALPLAVESPSVNITIPADALDKSVKRPGQNERFATAYVFMVACAGQLAAAPLKSGLGPNQIPVGCVGAGGNFLGPDEFVLGFTRIFVFDQRRNEVPKLDGLTFESAPIDPAIGIVTGPCVKDDKTGECKTVKLDALFNDAIAEVDPDNIDADGKIGRETIYVDWFTTVGKFNSDRRILFDGNLGRTPKPAVEFSPPNHPEKGTAWAVLHDNRGGTVWQAFPIEIK